LNLSVREIVCRSSIGFSLWIAYQSHRLKSMLHNCGGWRDVLFILWFGSSAGS